ncbi:hypothetical protein GQ53DRAFT_667146, partial [Thozetella sp. PMI_491]
MAPYRDFVHHLTSRPADRLRSYWKESLKGSEPCHFPQLNESKTNIPKQFRSRKVNLSVTAESLVSFCRQNEITLFHVFQAAWAIILRAYANTDEVSFGYATSGRHLDLPGISDAVGAYFSVLPCHMALEDSMRIRDVLKGFQKRGMENLEYHHVSLADVHHALGLSGETLFNTVLAFQNAVPETELATSLAIQQLNEHDPTEYAIVIIVSASEEGVTVSFNYWTDMVSEQQAANLASTISKTMAGIVNAKNTTIAELDLIGADQLSQIYSWNPTVSSGLDACFHTLFERQVQLRPNAQAVHAHDGNLTYAELDRYATKLAHHLVRRGGVRPETLVPFCFSKSMWTTVAIMAILKAGGGCVALDPAHPRSRLEKIVGDTGASMILAAPQHVPILSGLSGGRITIVPVDSALMGDLEEDSSTPCTTVASHNPAFIIFTSGSTGTPKGIVLEHKAIVTSCHKHGEILHMGPESRVFQFAAYTFDISIQDTCTTLIYGGCICVPSDYDRMNDVKGAINKMRCNWACLTPTVAELIKPAAVPSLAVLVTAGEALTKSVATKWAPAVDLNNCYGPAECTIHTMWSGKVTGASMASNIGRGFVNNVWLTNPRNQNQLVPIGCVGEITIEGPTVARGYLNLPEKTAEVFVESPSWAHAGSPRSRFYRSGDLARYNSDGTMDFVGRKDHQVKIRGQRLELGEIEHHISSHVLVKHVAVIKGTKGRCRERLVALIEFHQQGIAGADMESDEGIEIIPAEARQSATALVGVLRKTLTDALPSYMVPTFWAAITRMPLTSSGKTYRKGLKEWVDNMHQDTLLAISQFTTTAPATTTETPAQMTDTEKRIQAIWSRVLNLPTENISLNSSFLGLGGDSITATQVRTQCKLAQLGVSVQDILRSQTLQKVAACATALVDEEADAVVAEAEEYNSPFSLTPVQKLFFSHAPEGENHFNQSFMLRLRDPVRTETIRSALDTLVARHSMLRARFQRQWDRAWAQATSSPKDLNYHFQVCDVEMEFEIRDIAQAAQASLDIFDGPVFSATLFQGIGARELLLVAHHLVVDLVSWRSMLNELESIIRSQPLGPVPRSFQSWAKLRSQPATAPAAPSKPAPVEWDFWSMSPLHNRQDAVMETIFGMDESNTKVLLETGRDATSPGPVDLFLVAILDAFAHTFPAHSPPAIFVEGHGRDVDASVDISETVGWFTTISKFQPIIRRESDLLLNLRNVQEHRQQTKAQGADFLASLFPASQTSSPKQDTTMEILFNYEGQYQQLERADGLFQLLDLPAADVGKSARRMCLFEISAVVKARQLHFTFAYSRRAAHQARIRSWAFRTERTLRQLAARLAASSKKYAITDFPRVKLEESGLSMLVSQILPKLQESCPETPVIEDMYPCTPVQQGILLSQAQQAEAYAVQYVWDMKPQSGSVLDAARFRKAWDVVVQRHPALRTVFVQDLVEPGTYVQVVLDKIAPVFVHTTNAKDFAAAQKAPCYSHLRPPHRLTLCTSEGGKAMCQLDFSHSILDGLSVKTLLRDLSSAYEGRLPRGRGPSYAEFVDFVEKRDRAGSMDFWKSQLRGTEPCYFPNLSELAGGAKVAKELRCLPIDLKVSPETLTAFCANNNVTWFNIFQTAWALVLRAYTGSGNVVFGHLATGRDGLGTGGQNMLGMFVSTMLSHATIDSRDSVRKVIESIASSTLDSLDHQHCSLGEIQSALGYSGQKIFNTGIDLQRRTEPDLKAAIAFREVASWDPTEFDILVHFEAGEQTASANMTYWTTSLNDAHAQTVAETLVMAVGGILENPDRQISSLSLLSPKGCRQLLDWNLPIPEPRNRCLHHIFQEQVRLKPDAMALCSTATSLTYTQLDGLSDRLAARLEMLGVDTGAKVPILFEKSVWAVVSYIAVFKAGGCVVPLDPAHPMERLKSIIEQVAAPLLLSSTMQPGIWERMAMPTVVVDQSTIQTMPPTRIDEHSGASTNAAYIIFTSGTTGKPKGVVIEHHAFASNLKSMSSKLHIDRATRALQFSSYAFDGSIVETFAPLLLGGCVCIPTNAERSNNIAGFINRMKINWAAITPSFARLLSPKDLPTLKTLVLAGEGMSGDDVATWADALTLVNGYGPTETSVMALGNARVRRDTIGGSSNIGRPAGSTVWIVDPENHHRLMPIGCPGELLVGGPTVARGYLNNPAKTDEVFMPAPAWLPSSSLPAGGRDVRNLRFYKTGDLARYNSDGSVNFLGRKDGQVKLRGQRLELAEVEHHVLRHFSIAQQVTAQIVSRTGEAAHRQLVAFICLSGAPSSSDQTDCTAVDLSNKMVKELTEAAASLANALPPYMVPSMFVTVNRIPRTVSDKVDTKLLASIACGLDNAQAAKYSLALFSKRPATTAMEQQLTRLWEEVLGIPQRDVGIDDNFFQRGGDSIGAIKLVAAARRSNLDFTVADVFEHRTITGLSRIAKFQGVTQTTVAIPPFSLISQEERKRIMAGGVESLGVEAAQVEDIMPCTPLQESLLALSANQPGAYILQSVWRLGKEANHDKYLDAWRAISKANPILRTRVINTPEGSRQIVLAEDFVVAQSTSSLQEYLSQDKVDTMGYGYRLSRYGWVVEKGSHHFVWTAHHALYDGWSMKSIMDQLELAYLGNPVTGIQGFAPYVDYLSKTSPDAARDFWIADLKGSAASVFPRSPKLGRAVCADATAVHEFSFTRSDESSITTSTLLRAAWGLLLGKYSGLSDITYGTIATGRDVPLEGITEIVGPTIATIPVRVSLERTQTIAQFVSGVQQRIISTIPYQHVGLQQIRRYSPECQFACDFNTLFVVQPDSGPDDTSLPGVERIDVPLTRFYTYPLVVECEVRREAVKILVQHDPEVIAADEAQRLMQQLEHLVRQLVKHQQSSMLLGTLDIISPQDQDDILRWNRDCPAKVTSLYQDVVGLQIRYRPDALAISAWDGEITYRELDRLSSKLASYLAGMGVGPETVVPLCFEKSAWAVVSMLSVIKATGAIALLDPANPIDQLRSIVAQTGAKFILTSPSCQKLWQSELLTLPISDAAIWNLPSTRAASLPKASPQDLLYVAFTSGSAGEPKGCMVQHDAFLTSASAFTKRMDMDHTKRILQSTSYSSDASLLETLGSLTVGACICIPDSEPRRHGAAAMIQASKANWAFMTPSTVKSMQPRDVPTLRTLVLGGEALDSENVKTWASSLQLINGYGTSESSILSVINSHVTSSTEASNIGTPSGGRAWIVDVDESNCLVPVGCPGELLLEGHHLARGYLDHTDPNSAAFLENLKWAPDSTARRFYRTGDLAYFDSAGMVRYIGRKETQVMLRGHKITLGEIDKDLALQSAVKHAAVVCPQFGPHAEKLVAVVVLRDYISEAETPLELVQSEPRSAVSSVIASIQQSLAEKLPTYMLPDVVVPATAIPLSPAGRTNRGAIQKWVEGWTKEVQEQIDSLNGAESEQEPETGIEAQLRAICCQVLNLPSERVNMARSFVNVGGDSISAIQFTSKCRAEGLAIRVSDIMSPKTLSQLALTVKPSQQLVSASPAIPSRELVGTPFPLSPIQQMFIDKVAGKRFNQSFLLRLSRYVDPAKISQAVATVVKRHSMLRARFHRSHDGAWTQSVAATARGSFRYEAHSSCTDNQLLSIVERSQESLNMIQGPVFAADLCHMSHSGQVLFLVAHHHVVDLVSWREILGNLEELLERGSLSDPEPLPFQTWLSLQADHVRELPLANSLPFSVPESNLVYWNMEGAQNHYGSTAEINFSLDERITKAILGDCVNVLRTEPLDILLGVVSTAFSRTFTDRSAPAFYTESHGREPWTERINLASTVGWFTTMLPLPATAGDNVLEAIRKIHDSRQAVPDNGFSFFSSKFLGSKNLRSTEPVEIIFNYTGQYQQLETQDALLALQPRDERYASDVGDDVERPALIEISVSVLQGCFQVSFIYSNAIARKTQIHEWARLCQDLATELPLNLHAGNTEARLTSRSFTLMDLDDNEFEALAQERLPEIGVSDISDVEDIYPTTPMQHAILLSQEQDPEVYAVQSVFEVIPSDTARGIDVARLKRAWNDVVRRHPVLRTLFTDSVSRNGGVVQIVLKELAPEVTILKSDKSDKDTVRFLRDQPPVRGYMRRSPHRLTVCTAASGETFCRLDITHAICDAFSLNVLIRDLGMFYDGHITQSPGPRYSDFVSHLQRTAPAESLNYWSEYLHHAEPCLFPALCETKGITRELRRIETTFDGFAPLRAFCRKNLVTPANVVQAAWLLVLRSFAGSNNVCFGYLNAGRDAEIDGIQEAVGLFVNMLVCHAHIDPDCTALELVKQMRSDYIGSIPHQSCSLAEIQHRLDTGGKPLFNTTMSFQTVSGSSDGADGFEESGLAVKPLGGHDPTEHTISIGVASSDSSLETALTYWSDTFEDAQAENIASCLTAAIRAIVGMPSALATDLSVLSEQSMAQIQSWNAEPPITLSDCLHELFEARVSAQPFSPAVSADGICWTYFELNLLAEHLASQLGELGVGPETIVGYAFEPSPWAILAMLAILKAGGACVALDPKQPLDTAKAIISESRISVVIAQATYSDRYAGLARLVPLGPDQLQLHQLSLQVVAAKSPVPVQPHNLAFIIFTPDSNLRGVMLEHRALASSLPNQAKAFGITRGTRVLQFAPYSSNTSLGEIFTSLTHGACICVPSEQEKQSDLAGFINRMNVNVAHLPAFTASAITPDQVSCLKAVIVSDGETVPSWEDSGSLIHAYGPAESSLLCINRAHRGAQSAANIGAGLGALTWVVESDNHNKLVPIGAMGELLLEGPGLARGYLNDPRETSNAFLDRRPWEVSAGTSVQRLFKTGDLVRLNTDGTLSYVGRKDSMVKLRGQHIAVNEVEACIQETLPSVAAVIVEPIQLSPSSNNKVLAVFVVESVSGARNNADNRVLDMTDSFRVLIADAEPRLTHALPSHMVPSMFLPISRAPTDKTGTIDRVRLCQLAQAIPESRHADYSLQELKHKAELQSPTESTLRDLWAEVLNMSPDLIGADDNFFGLGGDSVAAMQLVAAADDVGVSLAVADIFRAPVLHDMARAATVVGTEGPAEAVSVPPFSLLGSGIGKTELLREVESLSGVSQNEVEDIYPCTPLQEGLVVSSIRQPGSYMSRDNQFLLPRSLDVARFRTAWEHTVQSLPILRTRIIKTKNYGHLQVVLSSGLKWEDTNSQTREQYLHRDATLPTEYGKPLARYAILNDRKTSDKYFFWSVHHALYDGWSMPMVWDQVMRAYEGRPLLGTTPFNHYIAYLASISTTESEEYWRRELAGFASPQFPQLSEQSQVARADTRLEYKIQLERPADSDITTSTLLRAAWAFLLSKYTDSDEVVFGLTLAGRNVPVSGVTSIVGPTMATVPARIYIAPNETVAEYLARLTAQSTSMIPHEYLGLQHIQKLGEDNREACKFKNLLVVQPERSGGMDCMLGMKPVSRQNLEFHDFPLTVECRLGKEEVTLEALYDPRILLPGQMNRILHQLEHVARQLNEATAETKVGDIDASSSLDRQQILSWNSDLPRKEESCIHELFRKQAIRQPNSPAVAAWNGNLTYRDLDNLSSQLAEHLISRYSVRPETYIPICFEKSLWAVVAIFGILKAGAAFVLLDPSHPVDRLQGIIGDIEAEYLISSDEQAKMCEALGPKGLRLNAHTFKASSRRTFSCPRSAVTPSNAAYVIFTSGTTGRPKGSVLEHSAFCTSALDHSKALCIRPNSRVLQFATFSFDASLVEIMTTLIVGGCVCIPSEDDRSNDIVGFIDRFHVNQAIITPSLARIIPPEMVPSLRTLVLAGEAMSKDDLVDWSHIELVNGYGPSECAVCVAANLMTPQTDPANIGQAVGGRNWIVDKDNYHRLVPVGCVGELLVEGHMLARHYLKNEQKTAETFVESPAWAAEIEACKRYYRTGDLVKYNVDGTMTFLGRKDSQVKLRGQRLELGEIE